MEKEIDKVQPPDEVDKPQKRRCCGAHFSMVM